MLMKFRKRVAHINHTRVDSRDEALGYMRKLQLGGIHPLKFVENTNPILLHFGEEEHLFFSIPLIGDDDKLCGYVFDEIIPNIPRYAHRLSPQGRSQYVNYD